MSDTTAPDGAARLLAVIEGHDKSTTTCACGKPAVCVGQFEGETLPMVACDECCNHEDFEEVGRCWPLPKRRRPMTAHDHGRPTRYHCPGGPVMSATKPIKGQTREVFMVYDDDECLGAGTRPEVDRLARRNGFAARITRGQADADGNVTDETTVWRREDVKS